MTLVELFPHLADDASWTCQQEAGDRMRAVYTAGAAKRQASVLGEKNVHLGNVRVVWDNRIDIPKSQQTYCIGLGFAFAMGRGMIVHRQMARRYPDSRRHHIENALRIRGALCWYGLDEKKRK
jgi:hypothetical protein